MSGSTQVKAKRKSGCRGTVKKASFRFPMVKYEGRGGMLGRRVGVLVTSGWVGITALLMNYVVGTGKLMYFMHWENRSVARPSAGVPERLGG